MKGIDCWKHLEKVFGGFKGLWVNLQFIKMDYTPPKYSEPQQIDTKNPPSAMGMSVRNICDKYPSSQYNHRRREAPQSPEKLPIIFYMPG